MSDRTAAFYASKGAVWLAIATLFVAMLLPILARPQRVEAARLLDRYIHMDSSASTSSPTTETTYYVQFQVPNGATVGSMRVEFCNEDPLPGEPCNTSTSSGVNVPDLDATDGSTNTAITTTNVQFGTSSSSPALGTPGTDNTSGCTVPALQTVNSGNTHFDIHCNAAETIVAATNDFVFIQVNNVDNPTVGANDPFYARIYTFSGTTATAYAAGAPPLGNYEGGVALSTAEQITVEARVQETLDFTVGVDAAADDCAIIAGSAVDLGVLTPTTINYASVNGVGAVPNTDVACAEVSTNASNGVNVYYVGDNLAIGSTSCANGDTDNAGAALENDFCINRVDDADTDGVLTTASTFEGWGLGVTGDSGVAFDTGSTSNLTAAAAYDLDTANEYSFTPNAVTLIASSTDVVDAELLEIDMAAAAAAQTPAGIYDTTLTFIATGTF